MNHKSLINIAHQLLELDPDADENQDLIRSTFQALGEKVNSYAFLDAYAKSQINLLKDEKRHLDNQIKNYDRMVDGLKSRALFVLEELNETSLKSETGHKISIRESERVDIEDLTKLPDKFVKKEISYTPDKIMIKDAIHSGESVPGARIIKNKSIVFK